jgi:hypothetical protein
MAKKSKTYIIARSSKTGQFIPVREASRHPKSVIIERIEKDYGGVPRELRSIVIRRSKKGR